MKAAMWTAYGSPEVLKIGDFEAPRPNANEVLVNVVASAVTSGDCRMRRFDVPLGLWLPTRLAFGVIRPRKKITGMDFSGEIVAVGDKVSLFKTGDKVFGSTGMACGANAEYLSIDENKSLVKLPDSLSHTEAAGLIFGGITALHFLKDHVTEHSKVLINGASGAVGSAAIQIAKHLDAEVTAVCSGGNTALVLSLGADQVIDYTKDDFTSQGVIYDLILDTVGNVTYSECKSVLSESGKVILINAGLGTILRSVITKRLVCGVALESKALLLEILALFESEKLRPIIDRIYPLDDIICAHRYVDQGHKKGNVVLTHD